ncbi:type II secretion system F family protein [Kineococcus gynurae]|uniref:Type II secretion system F family protein n=1 Tax=Kineococcus gynurae TaxID=452979 RepID=A0ABV5LXA1_9ACTN
MSPSFPTAPGTPAVLVGVLLAGGVFCLWWSCWPASPRSLRRRSRPLRRRLDAAGLAGVPVVVALLAVSIPALVVAALVQALTGVGTLALLAAGAVAAAPLLLLRTRVRARAVRRAEAWPDVVDHLGSAVRAGAALPEAVCHLAERGPVALRPDFAAFAVAYRVSGSFEVELDQLCDRLADPVADRIAAVLRMTRQVGGSDVGSTLRSLSTYLREDARTRSELLARQSWTVTAARLGVAAPWIVLALLATRPGALDAFRNATGGVVLLLGALGSVVAYLSMLRIARLPAPRRVFA